MAVERAPRPHTLWVFHQFSLCCLLLFGQLGCCSGWTTRMYNNSQSFPSPCLRPFMKNLTSQDYTPSPVPDSLKSSPQLSIMMQRAKLRTGNGRFRRTSTEWDWLMIKTVCAETSNPSVTPAMTLPC